jgi:hypothetical protein
LTLENSQLKKQLDKVQLENAELKDILSKKENPGKQLLKEDSDLKELKEVKQKIKCRTIRIYKEELNSCKKGKENCWRQ